MSRTYDEWKSDIGDWPNAGEESMEQMTERIRDLSQRARARHERYEANNETLCADCQHGHHEICQTVCSCPCSPQQAHHGLHSCEKCHRDFPGPDGGREFVEHRCEQWGQ